MRERLLVATGLVVLAVAVLYAIHWTEATRPEVVQPSVPFNHKAHLDAGFKCVACHVYARTESLASIPSVKECLECHASWRAKTPGIAQIEPHLKALAERGEEIPWRKVYRVPGHVYFSHQRHVALAKLDCAVCHGDMKQVTAPVVRQAVPIRMESCLECHRQKKVTTDCVSCHR